MGKNNNQAMVMRVAWRLRPLRRSHDDDDDDDDVDEGEEEKANVRSRVDLARDQEVGDERHSMESHDICPDAKCTT